jgi:hypothetical protein
MKMLHNNRFNLIHDDEIEPEDREDINLFIVCMYILAFILTVCVFVFIYQHF